MKNEKSWERTDKGGSSTESFDLRGRVSLLFCVLFFVVVLLHIFSLLHRRRSQRRHMEERAFFFLGGKNSAFHFLKLGILAPAYAPGGVLYRLKSRVLSFFFWIAETCTTKKESLTSFLLKTKNTYAIRNTRFSRQAKYSFGSVSRRPDMNVGEAMAASGNVSFRFTLRF